MKFSEQEKKLETLYEHDALDLRKPDKKFLKHLKTAAENTFKKERRSRKRYSLSVVNLRLNLSVCGG